MDNGTKNDTTSEIEVIVGGVGICFVILLLMVLLILFYNEPDLHSAAIDALLKCQ